MEHREPTEPGRASRSRRGRILPRTFLPLAIAAVLASHTRVAGADEPAGPYRVRWAVDLPALALSGLTGATLQHFLDDIVDPSCPCDGDTLNALDRSVLGRSSDAAGVASDVALMTTVALPFALDALDVSLSGQPRARFFDDAVVMAEAILVSTAITQLAKITFERPRPLLYGRAADDPALDDAENYVSFFSGHTSTAFAASMSYATTFALAHPDSPWRFVAYGAAATISGTIGVLRIESGNHFPTDVLTGAAMGTLAGVIIPWLHAQPRRATVTLLPTTEGALLSIAGEMP